MRSFLLTLALESGCSLPLTFVHWCGRHPSGSNIHLRFSCLYLFFFPRCHSARLGGNGSISPFAGRDSSVVRALLSKQTTHVIMVHRTHGHANRAGEEVPKLNVQSVGNGDEACAILPVSPNSKRRVFSCFLWDPWSRIKEHFFARTLLFLLLLVSLTNLLSIWIPSREGCGMWAWYEILVTVPNDIVRSNYIILYEDQLGPPLLFPGWIKFSKCLTTLFWTWWCTDVHTPTSLDSEKHRRESLVGPYPVAPRSVIEIITSPLFAGIKISNPTTN